MTISEECITLGPWGGSKGKNWEYIPRGFLKNITISYGDVIDCIIFQSETQRFRSGFSINGCADASICIQYPNEYLTSISGTTSSYGSSEIASSLCIHTNWRKYGPFGSVKGTGFSCNGNGGMIVGFHGRHGQFIDAIGVYLMPKSLALYRNSTFDNSSSIHQLFRAEILPREVGPWGASEGKVWDDGVYSNVKQVCVHLGKSSNVIYGIQFEYVKRDGKSILSPKHDGKHGGTGADKKELVNLDGTDEYVTGISGFYGPVEGFNGLKGITCITFHTNKRMYGPYGKEGGEEGYTYFTSTASPGKVVGFHGRKCDFLSAIGVHMEYF